MSRSLSRPLALVLAAALSVTAVACGDDDGGADLTATEWMAEFNRRCAEMIATTGPETPADEFQAYTQREFAELRDLGIPDEIADDAEAMLQAIEATLTDQSLSDEEITAYDERLLELMPALGVSDECMRGENG